MAFKRSAVRSRLSPPQKRTSGRMSFFVVKVGLGRTAVRTQGFLLHSKSAAARRSAVRRTNPQCHGGAEPRSIPLISTTKKDIRKEALRKELPYFLRKSVFKTAEILVNKGLPPFLYTCLPLICRLNLQVETKR